MRIHIKNSSSRAAGRERAVWTCENLTYSRAGLAGAMSLILLGFFTYTICVAFVPSIMPLKLAALGANNKVIVLIMGTIGQIFNITICPMVSFQSDRFRSRRWGRRIPFILFTMPMLCAAWILFAGMDAEARWMSDLLAPCWKIAPTTMAIGLIGVIMALYQFFLMYVGSVIYYIYNDTIPAVLLARFAGLVQVVSALGGALFSFFIFQHGLEHFRMLLLATAVVYTLGVGTMCLLLKEPRFPDPPPLAAGRKGWRTKLAGMETFFKESFSHRFYWYTFWGVGAVAAADCMAMFMAFFQLDMGLDMEHIGALYGANGLIGTVISFAVALGGAVLIDRWHPMRVYAIGMLFAMLLAMEQCKWIFFSPDSRVYGWIYLLTVSIFLPQTYFRNVAAMPALMRVYPKSRFGQFCSAQSMLRSAMVLGAGLVYGAATDLLKYDLKLGEYAYRFCFVWQAGWMLAAAGCFLLAYREFQQLGGDRNYSAPAPWAASGREPMPVTEVHGVRPDRLAKMLLLIDVAMLLPIAGAAALAWVAEHRQLPALAADFWQCALPVAAAVGCWWLVVRGSIAGDLRRLRRGEPPKHGLPHHGLLAIYGGTQLAMASLACWQSYAVMAAGSGLQSSRMFVYESVVGAVFVGLIGVYTRIERGVGAKCPAVVHEKNLIEKAV